MRRAAWRGREGDTSVRSMFRGSIAGLVIAGSLIWAAASPGAGGRPAAAINQGDRKPAKTVWDGVYTSAQAARGKEQYELNCVTCHGSGEGPPLVGESFMRRWFEDTLQDVFFKMQKSMPENAPGSLPDAAYVDVIGYLLEATGFPAGSEELTADKQKLSDVMIVGKGGPGGPVPDFSLVQVVGCLSQRPDKAWVLTNASEPVRSREPGDAPAAALAALGERPLGTQGFRLLDVTTGAQTHAGKKVVARGLIIRQPTETRINLTSLQPIGGGCPAQ
jgi:mono/diheme cytochrome c family protein